MLASPVTLFTVALSTIHSKTKRYGGNVLGDGKQVLETTTSLLVKISIVAQKRS